MPLEGLRWSRDSGSALYDTPQTAVLGRAGGGLPHFTREKKGDLRQAFPYIYKRCKFAGYELELKYKQKASLKFKEY